MSLTDDWNAGKLKNGWYFCLFENGTVFPSLYLGDDFNEWGLNQLIDSQQQTNQAMGKKLRGLYALLKECQNLLYMATPSEKEQRKLYRKIVTALGESEK